MKMLMLFSGLSGTDRDTLAARLSRERGWALLAKDSITRSLAQVDIADKFAAYTIMFGLAALNLRNDTPVVLDAPFSLPRTRTQARKVAEEHDATLLAISCICSDSARWEASLALNPPQSEGWASESFTSAEKMRQRYYPWRTPHLLLDAVNGADENYRALLTYLASSL